MMSSRVSRFLALGLFGAVMVLAPAQGEQAPPADIPAAAFFSALSSHCGVAYAGRIVANEPATDNDPFAGKALVVHLRRCSADRIEMPFHVGEDRSRTWVLQRTATGAIDFEHDHRHADGSEDVVTRYGGVTTKPGTAVRQEFPADSFSRELFEREGLAVSVTNVWAFELERGRLVYELARPGRLFRVEFDLTTPVAAPPAPWGHADLVVAP